MQHVYIHVPFCRRRCTYCDFAIAVRKTVPSEAFVAAVLRERELRRGADWVDGPVETLYLGGGTPSRLAPDLLARLVLAFEPSPDAEVTIEANPDDVTPAASGTWVAAGVNRVSLGVQSFHARVLQWMHRTHTADQAARAVDVLRAAGVRNLSLDLIFGLPGDLGHDFARDLDAALALDPDHLSLYGLTVEPRTPLARWIARGAATPPDDDRGAGLFVLAHDVLASAGYEHYEVSNYARPGRRARHNSAYWSGAAYGGLGPSAHGYQAGVRRWNIPVWTAWRAVVEAGRDPVAGREALTPEQRALETLYLGLRRRDGVEARAVREWHGEERCEAALAAGWLARHDDRLVPTIEGWLRLDSLLPFLTTSAVSG